MKGNANDQGGSIRDYVIPIFSRAPLVISGETEESFVGF